LLTIALLSSKGVLASGTSGLISGRRGEDIVCSCVILFSPRIQQGCIKLLE
jgi:hypothetical protein